MRKMLCILAGLLVVTTGFAKRKQWTERQAWKWQEKVGVIKGFNEPAPAYPGQSRREILKKASELGFNSVRFWVKGRTTSERVAYIQEVIDDATACGLTVSPVLAIPKDSYNKALRQKEPFAVDDYERQVRDLVRSFANDSRIVFWDLWNEPRFEDMPATYEQMDIIEQMVRWCWDEDLSQPITSSIIWATVNTGNKALKRTTEVEAMMDIHNFHSYDCALDFGHNIREMLDYIKGISNRPIVATECLTRTNGSGVARTLDVFARYGVNFYIWGLYANDRNWEVRWGRSAYDPYDAMFHNVLYSDGDLYDAREIELIRNYRFTAPDEQVYPELEVTDRWNHERSWRWMVAGPLMGVDASCGEWMQTEGCNAVKVKVNYAEWAADRAAFFAGFDSLLQQADRHNKTVLVTLLDDNDAQNEPLQLGKYVGSVVGRYYADTRIKAWDLYDRPGLLTSDTGKLTEIVPVVFRYARNQYANQPLMMTPAVGVKPFESGFDPWEAMVHGRTAGWERLQYPAGSTPELVYKIWSLSDVTAFSSDMAVAETGWLVAICYRFGRPIFCTSWDTSSSDDIGKTLERFAMFHVFWFADRLLPDRYSTFRFRQISTQRQETEAM
ncbi:MAG: cellulase family glycosylhydrolase [Prevotella sp.]|nr:cellulase family glycosylhydrolase [Prevotella sp.]